MGRSDPQDVLGYRRIEPGGGSGEPRVASSPVGGMVSAHDELAVRVRLRLGDFDEVILVVGQNGAVEFRCPITPPRVHSAITAQEFGWLKIEPFSLTPL